LRLAEGNQVRDGVVFRQPKAYPMYDRAYRQHVARIQDFLTTLENVQTIGRNGMHRYNTLDHSMLTGIAAARNLLGEDHDIWGLDDEESYMEEL
jgi:protoporphyrinogen oxidase